MEIRKFNKDEIKIFSGSASLELSKKIVEYLGVELSENKIQKFADGEIFTKSLESVRGSKAFVIQSTSGNVNENIMELLIFIDVLKRSSAKEIIAVIPYFGYARQDRKVDPRDPVTSKLIASLLSAAGATRIVTMELHRKQVQGFFDIPLDHVEALPILADYFEKKGFLQNEDTVVVAPDVGSVKRARELAKWLEIPLAIIEKRKNEDGKHDVENIIGDVHGKKVIIIDDMINTAKTIEMAADALMENGATEIYCCATHAIFSDLAVEKLKKSPIKEIIVTDTIELSEDKKFDKLTILSTDEIFGEVLRRIVTGKEVSNLFKK
nr:ribose-phosphate pyrophosphokinase [uncultured Leptotrichia sp.]